LILNTIFASAAIVKKSTKIYRKRNESRECF